MNEKTKIKRSLWQNFLDTTPGDGKETYARIGKGVTSQKISYNPQSTTEQYIDEDNATTSVDGYQPSLDGTQTAYKGDGVFEYLDELRKTRALGSALETSVVSVNLYDESGSGTYTAEKSKAVIQLGDFGGDGGGSLQITYTIALNGDPVLGTASVEDGTLTFTET